MIDIEQQVQALDVGIAKKVRILSYVRRAIALNQEDKIDLDELSHLSIRLIQLERMRLG